MLILDTNVLSEVMRPAPDGRVLNWLDEQSADSLWVTSITMAEIMYGIGRLPQGKRQAQLNEMALVMFAEDFAGRIAVFDEAAALHYAELACSRAQLGRPISMADAQIAAICRANSATLVTRNTKDFELLNLALIDPWSIPNQ